jgi:hypothetical protein
LPVTAGRSGRTEGQAKGEPTKLRETMKRQRHGSRARRAKVQARSDQEGITREARPDDEQQCPNANEQAGSEEDGGEADWKRGLTAVSGGRTRSLTDRPPAIVAVVVVRRFRRRRRRDEKKVVTL